MALSDPSSSARPGQATLAASTLTAHDVSCDRDHVISTLLQPK